MQETEMNEDIFKGQIVCGLAIYYRKSDGELVDGAANVCSDMDRNMRDRCRAFHGFDGASMTAEELVDWNDPRTPKIAVIED